jgi:hypothetical protein
MTIKNAREKFLFQDLLADCSDRETSNQRTAKKRLNSYIMRFTHTADTPPQGMSLL